MGFHPSTHPTNQPGPSASQPASNSQPASPVASPIWARRVKDRAVQMHGRPGRAVCSLQPAVAAATIDSVSV